MKRFGISIALAAAVFAWHLLAGNPSGASRGRIDDAIGLLSDSDRAALEDRLELFSKETAIDARFLFTPVPRETHLAIFAANRFDEMKLGSQSPGQRALLFVYDTRGESLRIHSNYDLESNLPDSLVGYFIHEHARYLFDDGDPAFALLLAIRMLQDHFRYQQLAGSFQPDGFRALRALRHRAGGGGAQAHAPISEKTLEAFPAIPESPGYGDAAGATVEETFATYLDWLGRGQFDPNAAFLTEGSRRLVAQWPMTPGYLDYLYLRDFPHEFQSLVRGDRAILFSTSSPFVSPHLFRRTGGVWQMDLEAEAQLVLSVAGGPLSWTLADAENAFSAFEEELISVGGFTRLARGDNRQL